MLDRRQIHTVVDTLIREARIRSVSDIHITEGMHVWYRIHGCLTQVNPTAGLTFDVGLRALMRQDPDIIMVGETRDGETAGTSVRAAITGHMVLSTLHTNYTESVNIRQDVVGFETNLIAMSLVYVIAIHLHKEVCDK